MTTVGLSKTQNRRIEEFLHLFADVEAALKLRLHRNANERTGVSTLINDFVGANPFWTDSANQLRHLADIRNVLTHQRGTALGYPIAVALHAVETLRGIKMHLLKPEPISYRFKKPVLSISSNHSLSNVLTMAFENGFSQFPVVNDRKFGGLITGNEITRWLGRRMKTNSGHVDLTGVTVTTLLREKDPFLRGIPIFRFAKLDCPADEVIGLFGAQPVLETVLLTESGTNHTVIEGIVTQWDAARYTRAR